ncbi:MAG: TrmJ/YjtD family RNA methyltransferase [Acidobacteria bacterium]|nr:TrmJ/YjtD family RNA methyltransferase [Acidobacteriota bacterium]
MMPPPECRIVLVRPRDPRNIGAVARAMKNFGFGDLWVVTPHPPTWSEIVSAPHAEDVLTSAHVVPVLAEAIADCNLVVGTGDPTRTNEERPLATPAELSLQLQQASYRLALVFGPEKHGLTNEDLCHCHQLLTIPTQPNCPSMNLGQAVAVCLYELIREPAPVPPPPSEQATSRASEVSMELALDLMRRVDFVLPGNEPDLVRRVRGALLKYRLSSYDTNMLCGILRKINDNISSTKTHEEDTK